MSCQTDCCKFLRGKVYVKDSGCSGSLSSLLGCKSKGPMRELGNVDSLNVFIESEVRGRPVKTLFVETPGCAQTIINNVRVQLVLTCVNKENLRMALYGSDSSSSDSGSVVDEMICGSNVDKCDYLPFKFSGISNVSLSVKDTGGATILTLVEGEDFKVDDSGVEFITGLDLPQNQFVCASYDYDESSFTSTEVLTGSKGPVTLYFRGTNLQNKGSYNVEMFKVVLQPATSLELISTDNFQSFQLNGILMRDCSKGEGLSEFMTIKEKKNAAECA